MSIKYLHELEPGAHFRLHGEDCEGKVLRVGQGSVSVRLDAKRVHSFVTEEGKEVEFSSYRKVEWSRKTRVEVGEVEGEAGF